MRYSDSHHYKHTHLLINLIPRRESCLVTSLLFFDTRVDALKTASIFIRTMYISFLLKYKETEGLQDRRAELVGLLCFLEIFVCY